MKKILKKAGGCALSLAMVFSISVPAFAAEDFNAKLTEAMKDSMSQPGFSVVAEDSGSVSVLVKSQGTSELVTAVDNGDKRTVTIRNTETGKEDYLIYDKQSSMVYSSITGKTVYLNNLEISSRSVSSYSTMYISYAEIKNTVGTTATVAGVVGLIMTKIPGAQLAGGVIGVIGTIVGGLDLAVPNSSNHGLRLRIKTSKFYRTRMGRRQLYKTTHTVASVSRY